MGNLFGRQRSLLLLVALLLFQVWGSGAVTVEKAAYAGWDNCYRVSNGEVEFVATTDVGPRIMRFGFVGGQNLFKEFEGELGKSGEPEWKPRGGHRLWKGPEDSVLTYALDNQTVQVTLLADGLTLTQASEPETGLQKQITIRMAPTGSRVTVEHRIRNTSGWSLRFAPWALTMMAPGGMGFTGFPPRGSHPEVLEPTHPLVMWAYSNLGDLRWKFTLKYMALQQDPNNSTPQKLGHFNPHTWGAYLLGSDLFVKRVTADPSAEYPDFGTSFQTFTNHEFLELETMGPLSSVAPGEATELTEVWTLHRDIRIPTVTDEALDAVFLPILQRP
jgi:hypothetical protein